MSESTEKVDHFAQYAAKFDRLCAAIEAGDVRVVTHDYPADLPTPAVRRIEVYSDPRTADDLAPWSFTFNGPGSVLVTFDGRSVVLNAGDSFETPAWKIVQ